MYICTHASTPGTTALQRPREELIQMPEAGVNKSSTGGEEQLSTKTYPQMRVGRAEYITLTRWQPGPNRFRMRVNCAKHNYLTG